MVQAYVDTLAILARFQHDLPVQEEPGALGHAIAAAALQIARADGAAVLEPEPGGGGGAILWCSAAAGTLHGARLRLPIQASLAGLSFVEGRLVLSEDADRDPRVYVQRARGLGVKAAVAIPLSELGTPLGVILVTSQTPRAFSAEITLGLQLLSALASTPFYRARLAKARQTTAAADEGAGGEGTGGARVCPMPDTVPTFLWVVDRQQECAYANQGFASFVGWDGEIPAGRGWMEVIHPEDQPRWREALTLASASGSRFETELRLQRPDGRSAWVLAVSAPLRAPDGTITGYICSGTDLTDHHRLLTSLRESEEFMSSALDAANLAVWQWAPDTGAITWSGPFEALLGRQEGEIPPSFDGYVACIHPEDQEDHNRALVTAMTGTTSFRHEHRIVRRDGSIRWLAEHGRFFYDIGGNPTRMTATLADVTDRRLLHQQLAQAQKIEAIGQLAAGIAHEINTPTQYVNDNLQFVRRACADVIQLARHALPALAAARTSPELAPLVEPIDRVAQAIDVAYLEENIPAALDQAIEGIEQVARIVRAMKDFSHPGSKHKQHADLNRIIENTITVSRNTWKYDAEMVTHLCPHLPPVPCYISEVQQALLNLVVNAAHAIADRRPAGGPGTITIRTSADEEWARIDVEDTGVGIPDELRDRIFEPFFTTKEVGRGTGQGLALARDVIANRHHGELFFHSVPGQGTTFTIRLPLSELAA